MTASVIYTLYNNDNGIEFLDEKDTFYPLGEYGLEMITYMIFEHEDVEDNVYYLNYVLKEYYNNDLGLVSEKLSSILEKEPQKAVDFLIKLIEKDFEVI